MRLFTILVATAHVAILALALGGESAAQNAPDCTACVQECSDTAQQCRDAVEDRADECAEPCYLKNYVAKLFCLTSCANARDDALASCDRTESSCVGNCYI